MNFKNLDEIVERASLDQDQYDFLVQNILKAWTTGPANLIRTIQAPMSAGKTYTIGRATIPALIQANPKANVFLYSSPRGDITKVFSQEVDDYLAFSDITCIDGTVKQVVVNDGAAMVALLDNLERAIKRGKTVEQFLRGTVIVLSVTIQWLGKNIERLKDSLDIDFAVFDEAHIGLQIGDITRGIPNPDSGRYLPSDYDPSWKPMAESLANNGTKVLAISATLSKSQHGDTDGGKLTFSPLATMPKREEKQTFTKAHFSSTLDEVFSDFRTFQLTRLNETRLLINAIDEKTWELAKQINVSPMLGRALVKAGRSTATNGLRLYDKNKFDEKISTTFHAELREHTRGLLNSSIFTVSTSDHTSYEQIVNVKFKEGYIDKKRGLEHIIEKLNNPNDHMSPAILAVIEMATVGVSIYDIDTVVFLSIPNNPGEVVASQVQTMGRGNRFPFKGMRSHDQMREQINSLPISLTQKYALARYVAHKCETHIFAVRTSLMIAAYEEYSTCTKTPDDGLQYYMSFMTPASPAFVKKIASPRHKLGYDASELNSTYKKLKCECCKVVNQDTGETMCEQLARENIEKMKGPIADMEWNEFWFKVLHLHHKDVNHFNYNPDNLITLCPNMHMIITIFEDHATKRYN